MDVEKLAGRVNRNHETLNWCVGYATTAGADFIKTSTTNPSASLTSRKNKRPFRTFHGSSSNLNIWALATCSGRGIRAGQTACSVIAEHSIPSLLAEFRRTRVLRCRRCEAE